MHALLLAVLTIAQPAGQAPREARAATVLFQHLNQERMRSGLPPLVLDSGLNEAAVEHVADMARNNYFEHTSPAGITPFDRMRRLGCSFSYAGENIALADDALQADRALFKSVPHRDNSLNARFTRVGIAVMANAQGRLLFVEDFSG